MIFLIVTGYNGGRWRGCCFTDKDSPLSMLAGIQEDVMRDIVWKRMVDIKKWQFYPEQ